VNIKQMLAEIAKPLLRPLPGPLREMSDDELAAAIATLEERVTEGEQRVARLQPELEEAAAQGFAGADLGSVENNAAAVRKAEAALTMARTTLAGLRHELERRAAESSIERAERRRKTAEAAAAAYVDQAKAMDDKTAEFVAAFNALHAAREALWQSLPEKIRGDFCLEQMAVPFVNEKLRNILCGATDGQLIRPKGLFSPYEIRQQPSLAEVVSLIQHMLPSVVFSGASE
jgi:hypothetical protein